MDHSHFCLSINGFDDDAASRAERVNEEIGGHALAVWLAEALRSRGIMAGTPWVEDHGWAFDLSRDGRVYLCTCSIDEGQPGPREAHVSIDLRRSLSDRLLGRNRMTADDAVAAMTREILTSDGRLRIVETA